LAAASEARLHSAAPADAAVIACALSRLALSVVQPFEDWLDIDAVVVADWAAL